MTEENDEFESTSPFAQRPEGPTPDRTSPFTPTASPAAEPASAAAGSSSGLRRAAPIAAFVVMVVLIAAAVGAVASHEVWTSTLPQAAAPPIANGGSSSTGNPNGNGNPFPGFFGGGGNGNGGNSTSNTNGGPSNPGAIAAKVDPAIVDINSQFGYQGSAGAGTGIILSSNGEVLTNNHVIEGATKITATDSNGKTYDATVVGYDPSHDIAVIQLQGASGLPTAKLGDSDKLSVGDAVIGIGNAGGTGGTPSAAGGQITGLNQSVQAGDDNGSVENLTGMIGTNANIQPGDSGGALVDANGNVIGMDTAGSQGFSFSSGGGSSNSAFAIPINLATATALQIVNNHPTSTTHVGPTAFLGVTVSSGGAQIPGFGSVGGSAASGVQVGAVLNGQAAQKAGLVAGDTITSLDGTAVSSQGTLAHTMLGHHPGDVVQVGYTDNSGASQTVNVTLGTGPAT